jgi:hypothetical protein
MSPFEQWRQGLPTRRRKVATPIQHGHQQPRVSARSLDDIYLHALASKLLACLGNTLERCWVSFVGMRDDCPSDRPARPACFTSTHRPILLVLYSTTPTRRGSTTASVARSTDYPVSEAI